MPGKKHFLSNAYEYFNTLTMVFYLVVSIPLLAFVVVYLQFQDGGGLQPNPSWQLVPHFIVPAVAIGSIVMAYRFYKNKIIAEAPATFRDKLRTFHQASLYKYALLGLSNLLPVLSMYVTGEQVFAGMYAIALVVFSLNRPTIRRITDDMQLTKQEQEWLSSDKNFNDLP